MQKAQSDLLLITDLAVDFVGWEAACIFLCDQNGYDVMACSGFGSPKRKERVQLSQDLLAGAGTTLLKASRREQRQWLGVPLFNSTDDLIAVLAVHRKNIYSPNAQDMVALSKLQSLTNSLIESRRTQQLAAEKQSELEITLEHMDQGISVFDTDARLVFWNQRYLDIFGIEARSVKKGTSLKTLIDTQKRTDGFEGFDTDDYYLMLAKLREGLARGEVVEGGVRLENGVVVSSVHCGLPDGGWVATHSDVTEKVSAQEKAEHASLHDDMTGLANRSKFTKAFEHLSNKGKRLMAMLIDIDHFKAVNDNYGHAAGDEVILSVADRLKSCVRESDVVARLGGDEFAVLLELPSNAGSEQTRDIAEKILERMRDRFLYKGAVIDFSVSIGACDVEAGQVDLETVLSRADYALYKAKQDGRATYRLFDKTAECDFSRTKRLKSLVVQEAYVEQLSVHFQPIVCLNTGKDYCCEALIRWAGNQSDHLTPSAIIRAAEESDAITTLGNWVLHEALKARESWTSGMRIAVNLSPRQLGKGVVVDQISQALGRWNLVPSNLELEVTEKTLLQDELTMDELFQLKTMGVQISLDDFGTGHSSLTLLQRFPFDKLKIDRSFVSQVDSNSLSRTIVEAVAGLAKKLDIETVAEGIETRRQLEVMRRIGCIMGQGNLLGWPMPADDITARLQKPKLVA
jgi:diguanylate cyclase (GGDEF)-like protein